MINKLPIMLVVFNSYITNAGMPSGSPSKSSKSRPRVQCCWWLSYQRRHEFLIWLLATQRCQVHAVHPRWYFERTGIGKVSTSSGFWVDRSSVSQAFGSLKSFVNQVCRFQSIEISWQRPLIESGEITYQSGHAYFLSSSWLRWF